MAADNNSEPIVSIAVEPKTATEQSMLIEMLRRLSREDVSLSIKVDPETQQAVIEGTSELHVNRAIKELVGRGIRINVGQFQVAYRETLSGAAESEHTLKTQTDIGTQFTRVKLRLEPNDKGQGNTFDVEVVEGSISTSCIASVKNGIHEACERGILVGAKLVDVKVALVDGTYQNSNSSIASFRKAGRNAFLEGCQKAGVKLLEPVMDVEIVTPDEFVGYVIGDINVRRGQVRGQRVSTDTTVISCFVPLERMFGYSDELCSLTHGRGTHGMRFSHFDEVLRRKGNDPDDFPPAVGMRS